MCRHIGKVGAGAILESPVRLDLKMQVRTRNVAGTAHLGQFPPGLNGSASHLDAVGGEVRIERVDVRVVLDDEAVAIPAVAAAVAVRAVRNGSGNRTCSGSVDPLVRGGRNKVKAGVVALLRDATVVDSAVQQIRMPSAAMVLRDYRDRDCWSKRPFQRTARMVKKSLSTYKPNQEPIEVSS